MANDHPFQLLFETLGRVPTSHAESVNRQAYEVLCEILSVPVEKTGRCILLRAPRAGHGKTHLLSRTQHQLGSTHEFIPLHPAFGCRIDAASVTDDALRRLVRPLPASGGLCVLDLITRRLFATALQPLVSSGEVPCQDREGALTALRNRPIETFDFHHSHAVTAHWARENFEVLGQRLSMELAQRCNLPVREVAFWVESLFRFAATPVENAGRVRALAELVHAGGQADGEAMERLEALLGLVSLLMRVVLVADDLEGFSADETAALRLAAFLGSLRQSVERLDVVLSLNQDIWQSAFLPRLSGGLADRLSEVVIELNPLSETEMIALLESRVPGLGNSVLSKIDRNAAGTHARGLIRAAGLAWLKSTATDSVPAVAPAAAPVAAATVFPASEAPVVSPFFAAPEPVAVVPEPEPVAVVPEPEPVVLKPTEVVSQPVSVVAEPVAFVPEPVAVVPEPEPVVPEPEPVVPEPEPVVLKTTEVVSQPAAVVPEPVAVVPEPAPVFQASPFTPVAPPARELTFEEQVSWPPPQFAPEPPAPQVVDSPFQISQPEPAAPQQWQPAPAAQFTPEPPAAQVVDSPFQISQPEPISQPQWQPAPAAQFTPEPVQSFQPQVESPFQVAQPVSAPEPAPTPVFIPEVLDSPFQQAPVDLPFQPSQEFNAPPVQAPYYAPETQAAPVETPFQPSFTPAPAAFQAPVESPFQVAPQQFTPEPAAFQPPVESPFQIAAEPPAPAFQAPPSQVFSQPAPSYGTEPAPVFHAAPDLAQPAPVQTPAPAQAPAAADTDRVDELLRQFRERYGR